MDPGASARGRVVFDGAHGIGAPKLQLLSPYMTGLLNIEVWVCTLLLGAVSARRDHVGSLTGGRRCRPVRLCAPLRVHVLD